MGFEKKEYVGDVCGPDLATMQRVRAAFDPLNICNPDKSFRGRSFSRRSGQHHPHPLETAGVAELAAKRLKRDDRIRGNCK